MLIKNGMKLVHKKRPTVLIVNGKCKDGWKCKVLRKDLKTSSKTQHNFNEFVLKTHYKELI